ncbi:hypothetical protein BDZ91DRAFT_797396 [Kalaharituber pfeilii]|nr:hypothetical protein BDZ91DRAFT_797396 [Kalaharituber pfeilii]
MELAGVVLTVVPLAAKLTKLAVDAYDIYKATDDRQSDLLLRLDIEKNKFCKWVEARRFTSKRAPRQRVDNPSANMKIEREYVLAFKIILKIIALLHEASKSSVDDGVQRPGLTPKKESSYLKVPKIKISISRKSSTLSFHSSTSKTTPNCSRPTTPAGRTHGVSQDFDNYMMEMEAKLGSISEGKLSEQLECLQKQLEISKACQKGKTSQSERIKEVLQKVALQNDPRLVQLVNDIQKWNEALDGLLTEFLVQTILPAPVNHPYNIPFTLPDGGALSQSFRFYGRNTIMKQITDHLDFEGRKTVVLHGFGGFGKTRIAQEYVANNSKYHTAIIWVDATTPETIKASAERFVESIIGELAKKLVPASRPNDFCDVANKLEVIVDSDTAGINDIVTRSALLKVVANAPEIILNKWLAREGNDRWILVADNFDRPQEAAPLLNSLLPDADVGHLIVTTREMQPENLVLKGDRERCDIEVGGFDDEENAENLLCAFATKGSPAGNATENTSAASVVKILQSALLISMAGAYICMNKDMKFTVYYDQLRRHTDKDRHSQQLKKDFVFGRAFDSISPKARKLLEVLAVYNPGRPVSEAIFKRWLENVEKDNNQNWISKEDLNHVIGELCSYRLVDPLFTVMSSAQDSTYRTFSVHAEIHTWIRERRRNSKDSHTEYSKIAWDLIASTIVLEDQARESNEWRYEKDVIQPHIEYVPLENEHHTTADNLNPSLTLAEPSALYRIARVCSHISHYQKAITLYRMVLLRADAINNRLDDSVLDSMDFLGCTLREMGKFEEAHELAKRALAMREEKEKVTGKPDPSKLQTAYNLALATAAKGDYTSALSQYDDLLREHVNAQTAGRDCDLFELKVMKAMAEIYQEMEQYDKSLKLLQDIREKWKSYDAGHPLILDVRTNLVAVHILRSKYKDALKECENLVKDKESIFGESHYSVLNTIIELGNVYISHGDFKKARQSYERAALGYSKIFNNPDHPSLLCALIGMATVLKDQGHYRESLELYERILEGQARAKPGTHTHFDAMNDVALILNRLGHYEAALQLFIHAENGGLAALGTSDTRDCVTLASGYGIATVLEWQGQYEEALSKFNEILKYESVAYGADHFSTLITVMNKASVLHKQGKYHEADDIYQKAIDGFTKAQGPEAHRTLEAILGQASLRESQGKLKEALEMVNRVIDCRQKHAVEGGHEHPSRYWEICTRGRILGKLGRHQEAIKDLDIGIGVLNRKLDPEHPWILEAYHYRAKFSAKGANRRETEEALRVLERVLEARKRRIGEHHPDTSQTKCEIARIEMHRRSRRAFAKKLLQEAVDELKQSLGAEHPTTRMAIAQHDKVEKK